MLHGKGKIFRGIKLSEVIREKQNEKIEASCQRLDGCDLGNVGKTARFIYPVCEGVVSVEH